MFWSKNILKVFVRAELGPALSCDLEFWTFLFGVQVDVPVPMSSIVGGIGRIFQVKFRKTSGDDFTYLKDIADQIYIHDNGIDILNSTDPQI